MKILDECDVMFGLVWLFEFGVCEFKPRMDCDHKVSVLLECDVEYYWTNFIYEFLLWISLFMVSLPLFVCLCLLYVRWSSKWCVIREQIILAWSRLTRGWDGLGSFYNIFSCFKSNTINYIIFFYSKCYWKFLTKWRFELCNLN